MPLSYERNKPMADRQTRTTPAPGPAPAETAVARSAARPGGPSWSWASRLGTVWFLVIVAVLARFTYPGFTESGNLRNILSQNAPIGLIAVGMTFAMICGGFDLSVGGIVAMSSVVFAKVALFAPLWQATGATLLLGLVLGLVNGVLVTRFEINPFIATLATASIYSGAAYLLSDSQPIVVDKPGFLRIGQGELAGLPISIWVMALAFVTGGLLLAGTVYGHCVYAVGGNKEAARLAGIRVDLTQIASYVIVGVMASLAGVMLSSRLGVGQADVGADMTLDAITIVVIGGTSLFGGEGAIWRTGVGLLLLGVIINVADSKGWSGSLENILKGCVLLGAVGLDVHVRRLRGRRRTP
jgi:ribose transport system permease protein